MYADDRTLLIYCPLCDNSLMPTGESARNLLNFLDASPTPYHAVETIRSLLESSGFLELRESEKWQLSPEKKYYVIRFCAMGTLAHESNIQPWTKMVICFDHEEIGRQHRARILLF